MLAHEQCGEIGLARFNRVEQCKVLSRRFDEAALISEFAQPQHAGLITQMSDHGDQPAVAQLFEESEVELPVLPEKYVDVSVSGATCALLGDVPELRKGRARYELGQLSHRRRFEHRSQL